MTKTQKTISWVISVVFIAIGIGNVLLVHPLPGLFYLVVALIYIPHFAKKVPFWVKIVLALLIIWPTLAVGDLAEMIEIGGIKL